MLQAVQDLSLARGLTKVQQIVRTAARELTGADGATFILNENGFCYYADEDAIAPLWKGRRFPQENCISGWVMRHREAAVISDIYADPRIPHEVYRPTFVRSLAMVPIRTNEPIGAIGNYWATQHLPGKIDLWLLQALADAASIAVENVQVYSELEQRVQERTRELAEAKEELERLSVTDELTGLHNRRGFYRLAHRALGGGRRFLLVYIDVDGLKHVNDRHGHAAGDALIKAVADALRSSFRHTDILARIGGDEFCVLVPDPHDDAETLRNAIKLRIEELNQASAKFRYSASLGVLEAAADDLDSLDGLIARADELMYRDKQAKRTA
ncbi:MAG TPA: sensor domain-containing diguanylate cyclase [Bauldia sp.]|nr:sensor domain-containing diguanylate cyclase [Bauldia sp.]